MKITDHKLPEGIALTFRVPEGNMSKRQRSTVLTLIYW